MKENLQFFWILNNKNALCWAIYYVNDNKDVLLEILHIISYMHFCDCVFLHYTINLLT
jgi:hypothetical protein